MYQNTSFRLKYLDCEVSAVKSNCVPNIKRLHCVELIVVWWWLGDTVSAYQRSLRNTAVFLTGFVNLDAVVFQVVEYRAARARG